MTRIIKATEVRPGMTIRWKDRGFTHEGPVERVVSDCGGHAVRALNGTYGMSIWNDKEVTVLAEPAPEEPTAFGARVVVVGRKVHRCTGDTGDKWAWEGEGADGTFRSYTWPQLCALGPVTIIDADPSWTVPETPVVPERIEEWPEHDEHLREHQWKDRDGDVWQWNEHEEKWSCRSGRTSIHFGQTPKPTYGPWTRVQ